MRTALLLLAALLLSGCAVSPRCWGGAQRYADVTKVKVPDKFEMEYAVEWTCVPAQTIERSQGNGDRGAT